MFTLADLFLFQNVGTEERERMLGMLPPPLNFKKGETIYDTDSSHKAIGVFLSGEGYAGVTETRLVKAAFREGSVFGAAALFGSGQTYVSRICARTDCVVQFIPEEILKGWMSRCPQIAMNYIAFLSERVRFLNRKMDQLSGDSTTARLYRYLADNADATGEVRTRGMAEVARQTGMGRTSLYRALAELEGTGVLRQSGKTIQMT